MAGPSASRSLWRTSLCGQEQSLVRAKAAFLACKATHQKPLIPFLTSGIKNASPTPPARPATREEPPSLGNRESNQVRWGMGTRHTSPPDWMENNPMEKNIFSSLKKFFF